MNESTVQFPDLFADGDILRFVKKFSASDRTSYTYAAVKAGGSWYLTGSIGKLTWSALQDIVYARLSSTGSGSVSADLVSGFEAL